jgi:site-specific DNA recombinase
MSKNGAVGYFRVSTAEQANQNNSLPTQEAKFNNFCMNNALTVGKIFTDRQSARTDARPEFQRMLTYCQQNRKKISHVIVADLSRLARNVLDQGQAIVSLKQWGIELASIDEPITDDTAAGKLARNMIASVNQFFSDSLSEKTKYRMAEGVKQGRWLWVAPLGYLNDTHSKQTVPDPSRAGLVRKAFELIADKDYSSAFRVVTSMGLTTRTGRPIPKQTFSRMIRNEFYAGWIVSGDVRVKGTHEPLISEGLFTAVQAKLDGGQPHQKEHEDFPLRGFLRCAGCDKALTAGWVRGRNGQRYARYWCWRKGCKAAASKEELEAHFCILLSQIQPTAELLAKLPAIAARTWETRKEQIAEDAKALTRRLEEQRALNLRTIKSKIDGHLSDEDFRTMKTSITEEMARIEETMKSLDAEKSSYRDLMQQAEAEVINFERAWREGGLHRKRELQNALFPEGLKWWVKRKVFETGKGLSIHDLGTVFDTLGLVGVPDGI